MDWFKQYTDYYLEPEMIDAGEEAEVLRLRAKAYSARTESGGFIPEGALPLITPKRYKQRAASLVRVGLWEAVPGGYRIVDWDEEQAELEALVSRRRSDRNRKRAQRERDRTGSIVESEAHQSTDPSRDRHVTSHGTVTDHKRESKRREETTTSPSSADADGETAPKRKPKRPAPPDGFGVFWDAYPRKVAKAAAEKAYTRALADGADPALILAGAEFYALERKLQDPKYTKHPATWLNARCWEDEPDPEYRPPVITGPSEAASAAPRPWHQVRADQQARSGGALPPELADSAPWLPQIGMNLDD